MFCRVCNSPDLKLFYEHGNSNQFKYYKCCNCGLVNLDLNNIPISKNQEKYFEVFKPIDNYESANGAKLSYRFIKKYVPIKGHYLDIGCGGGALLYFAKKDGHNVTGLEISPDYAKYVTEKLNVNVFVANFLEFDKTELKFDIISLRHVLEHLPDAILAMNKIHSMLKEGGYGHFEFPNINSLSHRFQRFLAKTKLHNRKYSETYKPGHCNEYSKKAFCHLLKITNFELVRWETYSNKPYTNWIYNNIHVGTRARAIVRKKQSNS